MRSYNQGLKAQCTSAVGYGLAKQHEKFGGVPRKNDSSTLSTSPSMPKLTAHCPVKYGRKQQQAEVRKFQFVLLKLALQLFSLGQTTSSDIQQEREDQL